MLEMFMKKTWNGLVLLKYTEENEHRNCQTCSRFMSSQQLEQHNFLTILKSTIILIIAVTQMIKYFVYLESLGIQFHGLHMWLT